MIHSENTSINRGVATSVKMLAEDLPPCIVLDYGAGRLRHAYFLSDKGFDVTVLDTPKQAKRIAYAETVFSWHTNDHPVPPNAFDAILLTFVLNVVDDKSVREAIIEECALAVGGCGDIYIEVRTPQSVEQAKHKTPYKDGYLIGKHKLTFQKGFTEEGLVALVAPWFVVEKIITKHDSIILVGKRDVYV